MFAKRMEKVKKSFIREILKVTEDPEIISFAGGLPNPTTFPALALKTAAIEVLDEDAGNVLQYSTTEGYKPLREYICNRYEAKQGISVNPDEILIINGSQQGLDLVAKAFLNIGDKVLIEKPGYLGALQAFSVFEPEFIEIEMENDGPNLIKLEQILIKEKPKIFYAVPNFQNPSGISYSLEKRKAVAELLNKYHTILVEDNPYGELRFMGDNLPSIKKFLGERSILLGSFSKIVSPGMRLGWICACEEFMSKLVVAKQASDLHSNYFSQRVVERFLMENDLDNHIKKITNLYKAQRDCMVNSIREYFPTGITYTEPEGGMFLWVTLPKGVSSLELFDEAISMKVAFVPGDPFYVNESHTNTLRLNYTNSDETAIKDGIRRLSEAIASIINKL